QHARSDQQNHDRKIHAAPADSASATAPLNDIIVQTMSGDPDQRFDRASTLGAELDDFLTSCGFDESHIELERFFRDPKAFKKRLDALGFEAKRITSKRQPPRQRKTAMTGIQTTKD